MRVVGRFAASSVRYGERGSLTNRIQVALAQFRPVLGDVAANRDKHQEFIAKARAAGAQLIVFPELGLTGYQLQDLTLDVARTLDHPDILGMVAKSQDIDIVFSFVEESPAHLFYVTAVYASGGRVVGKHRKVYLPTYGMFDEGRYFAAGDSFQTFETPHGCAGMLICEDAWHVSSPYVLGLGGANLLIMPSNSPARSVTDEERFGSQTFWRQLLQTYAQLFGVPVIFVNRVGFEDGVSFFGGSCVVSAQGEFIVEAPHLEEALVYASVDQDGTRRARYSTGVLRDEKPDLVLRELRRLQSGPGREGQR